MEPVPANTRFRIYFRLPGCAHRRVIFWLAAGSFILLMQSCITTPFLKKDEYLLIGQRVKGNKKVESEDLEALFRQKANRKILGFTPYLGFYFFGKTLWDTTRIKQKIARKEARFNRKIARLPPGSSKDSIDLLVKKEKRTKRLYTKLREGNFWMRVVGEPPAIYDSSLANETKREIGLYLYNNGFFDNTVTKTTDTLLGGNVSVKYQINENEVHRIRKIEHLTNDYRLKLLIDSASNNTLLKVGAPYTKAHISGERERFEKLFKNKGYYAFSREYIRFVADTSGRLPASHADSLLFKDKPELFSRLGVDIKMIIQNPQEGKHIAYVVDSIEFRLNESDTEGDEDEKELKTYNQVDYYLSKRKNYILDVLDRKILVHPRQYFSYSKITNTQAQLSGMDMFRYVNVSLDTAGTNMKIRLIANRLPKYQISDELGLLMSQGAPGPYINVGFKIRNLLGGFEVFEANVRYSQEGTISTFVPNNTVFRARDLTISSSFTLSKIILPFGLGRKLNEYNPKTRYVFSLSALKRPEYIRNLVKGSLLYTVQLSPTDQLGITPTDVTVNITPPDALNPEYLAQLIQFSGLGESVRQSFRQAIVTNFNAFYMFNNNLGNLKKRAKYFRASIEYGGELLHLFQKYVQKSDDGQIGEFKTFRYAKTQADYRIYNPIARNTLVAFRLMGGVAVPVGNSKVLPWEKYYFSGGSNGIRAWAPRRLGPGSYAPSGADPNNLTTEQPGELILESNIEVRQKLVGFLEGALFADAGNVWNLKKDAERPGAEINPLFLQQIALGGGFGIRFDFSFLIVRVDIATKLYNPAFESDRDKWQIRNISWKRPFGVKGQTLVNLGIGYPF